MKRLLLISLTIVMLSGCTPQVKPQKPTVVTSFYPLYFFTSQIVGEKMNITNLTPAGAEPHDYELSPQDMTKIENSRVLIMNGGGLEAWGKNITQNVDKNKTTVVIASEDLTDRQMDEDGKKIVDPHTWLSPKLAIHETQTIASALKKVDPENANEYEANSEDLVSRLKKLDSDYEIGLRECRTRDIVTSHSAFGYLANSYGLNQVSIAGLSPDEEPSSKQLVDIATFARQHQVGTIFFESLVSPKLSQTIAKEIGAKTLVLDPLEGISDADVQAGETYFTIMEANLANLRSALSCN